MIFRTLGCPCQLFKPHFCCPENESFEGQGISKMTIPESPEGSIRSGITALYQDFCVQNHLRKSSFWVWEKSQTSCIWSYLSHATYWSLIRRWSPDNDLSMPSPLLKILFLWKIYFLCPSMSSFKPPLPKAFSIYIKWPLVLLQGDSSPKSRHG